MINFISAHISNRIENTLTSKFKILGHDGYYYFNEPIRCGNKTIDRGSRFFLFEKDLTTPLSWYSIGGKHLVEILKRVENNEFYVYKKIENKDHKFRIKNVIK